MGRKRRNKQTFASVARAAGSWEGFGGIRKEIGVWVCGTLCGVATSSDVQPSPARDGMLRTQASRFHSSLQKWRHTSLNCSSSQIYSHRSRVIPRGWIRVPGRALAPPSERRLLVCAAPSRHAPLPAQSSHRTALWTTLCSALQSSSSPFKSSRSFSTQPTLLGPGPLRCGSNMT